MDDLLMVSVLTNVAFLIHTWYNSGKYAYYQKMQAYQIDTIQTVIIVLAKKAGLTVTQVTEGGTTDEM